MLDNIRIVLCETSHPGNIGAAARAMKNMGLRQLILVSPHKFPAKEAIDRASGADDILSCAQVVSTLKEAIADCQWVFGTSSRQREFPWPQLSPKQAVVKLVPFALSQQIAVVFGTESAGLSNDQLQCCDYHICIPTHPDYSSLNLAAAVQVISYEIYQMWLEREETVEPLQQLFEKANAEEIAGMLQHFEQTAIALRFLDPHNPKKLVPRLKRLFAKAQLEKEEVNILRGLLKAMDQKL